MDSSHRSLKVRGGRSLNCCNIWAIVGVVRVMKGCSQCFVTLECCALLPGDVFFSMLELSSDLQCVPTSVALFCFKSATHFHSVSSCEWGLTKIFLGRMTLLV